MVATGRTSGNRLASWWMGGIPDVPYSRSNGVVWSRHPHHPADGRSRAQPVPSGGSAGDPARPGTTGTGRSAYVSGDHLVAAVPSWARTTPRTTPTQTAHSAIRIRVRIEHWILICLPSETGVDRVASGRAGSRTRHARPSPRDRRAGLGPGCRYRGWRVGRRPAGAVVRLRALGKVAAPAAGEAAASKAAAAKVVPNKRVSCRTAIRIPGSDSVGR